jgi:hypothetical protein
LSILNSAPATAVPNGSFGATFQAAISDATQRQSGSDSGGADATPVPSAAAAANNTGSDQGEESQAVSGQGVGGATALIPAANGVVAWAGNGASSGQIAAAQILTAENVIPGLAPGDGASEQLASAQVASGAASNVSSQDVTDQVAHAMPYPTIQLPVARAYAAHGSVTADNAGVQSGTSTFIGLRPSVPATATGQVANELAGESQAAGGNVVAGTTSTAALAQSAGEAGVSAEVGSGPRQVPVAVDVTSSAVTIFAAKGAAGQTSTAVLPALGAAPVSSGHRRSGAASDVSGTAGDASHRSASTGSDLSQPSQSSLSQVAAAAMDQVAAVLPQPTIANPVAQFYASAGSGGASGTDVRRGTPGGAVATQGTQAGVANSGFIFRAPLTQANQLPVGANQLRATATQLPVAGTVAPASGSGQDAGSAASSTATSISAEVSRQAGSLHLSMAPAGATAVTGNNQAGTQAAAAQAGYGRRATDAAAAEPVAAAVAQSVGSATGLPVATELLNAAMNLPVAAVLPNGTGQQAAVTTQKDGLRGAGVKGSDGTSISGVAGSSGAVSGASRSKDVNGAGDGMGNLTAHGGQNNGSLGGGSPSSGSQSNGQPAPHAAAGTTPVGATRVVDGQVSQAMAVPMQATAHVSASTAAGGLGGSREALGRNDAAGLPQEVDDTAPASGINAARVMQSMGGTEMRVGMHSTEYGDISIRTSLSPQQMTTQISVDHSELGQAISAHASGVQARFQEQYGMQSSIEVNRQGSALSGGSGDSPQREQQGFVRSARVENAAVSTEPDVGLSQLAMVGADSGYRLDIRA